MQCCEALGTSETLTSASDFQRPVNCCQLFNSDNGAEKLSSYRVISPPDFIHAFSRDSHTCVQTFYLQNQGLYAIVDKIICQGVLKTLRELTGCSRNQGNVCTVFKYVHFPALACRSRSGHFLWSHRYVPKYGFSNSKWF